MIQDQLTARAIDWLKKLDGENFLTDEEYCQTRDVFQARLDKLRLTLEQKLQQKDFIYLLVAVAGEIGNNAFDHNIGAWKDVAGVYFGHDFGSQIIVIADRGQGIFKTIKQVKPEVKNDLEALTVAFTETISGRSPEKRGNGLKFVAAVASSNPIAVGVHSGNAQAIVNQQSGLQIKPAPNTIDGTLGVITYTTI